MTTLQKITTVFDPWEAYLDVEQHGQMTLSNIEFTTTTLCNMRCAHCAVGYTLQNKDPGALPIELILKRLDEIPHLKTISITGGERPNIKDITSFKSSEVPSSLDLPSMSDKPTLSIM